MYLRVIFESENDFALCIKQSFPRLKTTKLRRKQWCILRSLIGKPRRCSDAFFQEERHMLEEKRQKIRLIQQRKVSEKELVDLKDLPQEIPLTLSIGHRVYSHISTPEEGVFLGTIAAVDPCEHTYRVVFDRQSVGSQTVYDYEIKSVAPVQTIPIRAYIQTYRPKLTPNPLNTPNQSTKLAALAAAAASSPNSTPINTTNQSIISTNAPNSTTLTNLINSTCPSVNNLVIDDFNTLNAANPGFAAALMLNQTDESINNNLIGNKTGILGGFPIHLLLMITRLNKILNVKRECLKKINDMNKEAEGIRASNQSFDKEFQINYALVVLDLEKLNKDLNDYLIGVQRYCEEYSNDFKFKSQSNSMLIKPEPSESESKSNTDYLFSETHLEHMKLVYLNEARQFVDKYNRENDLANDSSNSNNISDQIEHNMNNINLNDYNPKIKSKHLVELITKLTGVLLQLRDYISSTNDNSENDKNGKSFIPFCTRSLNDSIDEIKYGLLSRNNINLFEDKVQIHLNHIQSTLCHYSKLHAFNYELSNEFQISEQDESMTMSRDEAADMEDEEEDDDNENIDDDEDDDQLEDNDEDYVYNEGRKSRSKKKDLNVSNGSAARSSSASSSLVLDAGLSNSSTNRNKLGITI